MRHAVAAVESGLAGASRTGGPFYLRHLVAATVLLALILRIGVVLVDTGYEPGNDALEYDYLARSIAAGDGYPQSGYLLQGGPTAIRGPGYPVFLGGVYALSGDSRLAGRLAGAALGAIAVLLLYLVAKRIWGRRVGLVAAGMAAVFPPLVLLNLELLSEPLFIAIVLGTLLCVLNFRRSGGTLRWALAAGALCGLAILTRNAGLALLPAVVLGVWTQRPRLRAEALLAPLLAVVCATLIVAPWTLRNAAEFGRFVPTGTGSGFAIAGTYNTDSHRDAETHGAWRNPQTIPQFEPLFVTPGIDEGAVDVALRQAARDFAWQHPGYVAETSAWNLLRLFEVVGGSVVDSRGELVDDRGIGSAVPTSERIGIAIVAALALLGFLAIARARLRSRRDVEPPRTPSGPLFLWLVPALMILLTIPIAGLPRYRLPIDPFMLMLAAVGAVSLWDRRMATLRGDG